MHFPRPATIAERYTRHAFPRTLRARAARLGGRGKSGFGAALLSVVFVAIGGCSDGEGVSFTDTPAASGAGSAGGSGSQTGAGGSATSSGGSLGSAGSPEGAGGELLNEGGAETGESGAGGEAASGGSAGPTSSGGSAGKTGSGGMTSGGTGAGSMTSGGTGAGGSAGRGGTAGMGAGGSSGAGGGGTGGSSGSAGSATGGSGGNNACVPSTEICDGLDNDCDGRADESSICPTNCTGATFGGHVYYFCRALVARATAAQRCNGFDLRLVSIDSAAENDFVEANASGTTWLGAGDEPEGTWRWPDGTQFWKGAANGTAYMDRFAHWVSGQPDDQGTAGIHENCAVMVVGNSTSSGLWRDVACLLPDYRYTCESYEGAAQESPQPDPGEQPEPGNQSAGTGGSGNQSGGPGR